MTSDGGRGLRKERDVQKIILELTGSLRRRQEQGESRYLTRFKP